MRQLLHHHHRNALRFCLWGGGELSVQVGSPTDRRIQIQRQMVANVERMATAIGDALRPALQRVAESMAELGKAFERSRSWL